MPLGILAAIAFAAGIAVAGSSPAVDAASRFAAAWEEGDYDSMYAELSPGARQRLDAGDLRRAYADAARVATAGEIDAGDPGDPRDVRGEDLISIPVTVDTAAFGEVRAAIEAPISDDAIDWRESMVFPGLRAGEHLERRIRVPRRAPILARDRTPIAQGPLNARDTSGPGGYLAGEIGEPPKERAREMAQAGFPEGTPAGASGLELAFDEILAGTPGGKLLAVGPGGRRALASRAPQHGKAVRTTIDPKLQQATAAALGDSYGGAAVLDARDGDVLALAGFAFSAPQPPGSTFKVITVAGALAAGVTKPSEEFPVETEAVIGGRPIANAYDEPCGGTLVQSFAHSCNSVFAPLGVRLGGEELVAVTERFGFNSPPSLYSPDALALTKPPSSAIPEELNDELDIAVSALGQGQVLATPLEMASVAQTIANGGVRSPTAIVHDPELSGNYPDVKVVPPGVARRVREMMVAVVQSGTGAAASLPDAVVAGKTGTAELGTTSGGEGGEGDEPEPDVDAWFIAFAPAKKPKLAVAVMIVNAPGDGGTVAAPIARAILDAGL